MFGLTADCRTDFVSEVASCQERIVSAGWRTHRQHSHMTLIHVTPHLTKNDSQDLTNSWPNDVHLFCIWELTANGFSSKADISVSSAASHRQIFSAREKTGRGCWKGSCTEAAEMGVGHDPTPRRRGAVQRHYHWITSLVHSRFADVFNTRTPL